MLYKAFGDVRIFYRKEVRRVHILQASVRHFHRIPGLDIRIDFLCLPEEIVVHGSQHTLIHKVIVLDDFHHFFDNILVVAVVFYFDIQVDFSFRVRDDFFQLRNLLAAEFFVESYTGIELADFIVGQGPDAGIQTGCPLQICVVHKDNLTITRLLYIDLRVIRHAVHCIFDRAHRIFRCFSGSAPVR